MSTISVTVPSDGETIDAADIATPLNTIVNDYNGNIDNSNIATLAAISGTKLADSSIPIAKIANDTAQAADGWIKTSDTWTYASASTFLVSGDVTARYTAGTRLKFTQSTIKYGTVASSSYSAPNTTVTIIVNTDHVLANASITLPSYSYDANPQGYPSWFNYTPTFGSLSGGTLTNALFSVVGKTMNIRFTYTLTGANVSGSVTFSPPTATASYGAAGNGIVGGAKYGDTGSIDYYGPVIWSTTTAFILRVWNASGTYLNNTDLSSTIPHTWASTDVISASVTVQIA